jgi:hypothetical protein
MIPFLVAGTVFFTVAIFAIIAANISYDPRCEHFMFSMPIVLMQLGGIVMLVTGTYFATNDHWEKYLVSKGHAYYGRQEGTDNNHPVGDVELRFQLREFPK